MAEENISGYGKSSYGKRPLWQWLLIYAIVGAVVYGLIYYFVLAKKGGTAYSPTPTPPAATVVPTKVPEATSSVTQTKEETVILTKTGFAPTPLTVKAGTKVTWTNQSGTTATVNSSPHPAHTDYPPLNLGS